MKKQGREVLDFLTGTDRRASLSPKAEDEGDLLA